MPTTENTISSSSPLPENKPKSIKAVDKKIVAAAILGAVVLGGLAGYLIVSLSSSNTPSSININNNTASSNFTSTPATTFTPTVIVTPLPIELKTSLVFQKSDGNTSNPTLTTSVTDSQGNLIKKYSATSSDSTFSITSSNSSGRLSLTSGAITNNQILTNSQVSVTKSALLKADGTSTPVTSAIQDGKNGLGTNPFVLKNNSILELRMTNPNTLEYDYDQIDLTTGNVQTLFKVKLNDSNVSAVTPQEINYDQTEVTFIVNRSTINDKSIIYPTVMVYNLKDKTFTYKELPKSDANTEIYGTSTDGELALYSKFNVVNGVQQGTTHIYNFSTQKDIVLPDSYAVSLGSAPSFSMDNKYMYMSLSNSIGAIYSVSDGKLVKKLNFGDPAFNFFQFVGWTSNTQFGYNVQKSTHANNFDGTNSTSHSYDISTGVTKDYSSSLGKLEIVLVKN